MAWGDNDPAAKGSWGDSDPVAVAPKPAPKKPTDPVTYVTGLMANVNRGLGIGDEMAAGFATAGDVVTGKTAPGDVVQGFQSNMAKQRQEEDSFRADNRTASNLALGTGNALTSLIPAGKTAQAFAEAPRVVNALRGAVAGGATAAAYGAADRGTAQERLQAASEGATNPLALGLGAVGGALGPAASKARPAKPAPAPTIDQLRAQKNAAYDAVDKSGVTYDPKAFDSFVDDTTASMQKANISPTRHPKAASMLADIQAMKGQAPSLTQMDQLRQVIRRDVGNSNDPAEQFFGRKMIDQVDVFIDTAKSAARRAAALSQDGKPITFYHGSPSADIKTFEPRGEINPKGDFPPVVSFSTDPAFASNYAGEAGTVYPARIHASDVGDFRKPEDVQKVIDFYQTRHGELDANDIEAIKHGSWRLWENKDLWKERGWEGVWNREEPGATNSNPLNISLGSGEKVRGLFDNTPAPEVPGSREDGAGLIRTARDLNTRVRKIDTVNDAVESARLRAGSTGSGGNVDNATRQNLRRVLEKTKNFTDDEAAALERIVMGSKGQNALRQVGKLSPQGNGLMTALSIGGAAANPLLAIPTAAGAVSKVAADAITQRRVRELVDLIARGGKLGDIQAATRELSQIAKSATGGQAAARLGRAGAVAAQSETGRTHELTVDRSTNPDHLAWRKQQGLN